MLDETLQTSIPLIYKDAHTGRRSIRMRQKSQNGAMHDVDSVLEGIDAELTFTSFLRLLSALSVCATGDDMVSIETQVLWLYFLIIPSQNTHFTIYFVSYHLFYVFYSFFFNHFPKFTFFLTF